ncbi:MAG: carboxymuconolactone decarboxylase family protein [Chloroflexi bacterium]|nr:carboxymuconolactone decarboxylase family protein [Chloroflexota bacterium]
MAEPLKIFETLDPELLRRLQESRDAALADGALPRKVKLLIAMSLDAAHGAASGVGSLARTAMAAGATKEEVLEALRVAHYISGAGAVYTAARGFQDVF